MSTLDILVGLEALMSKRDRPRGRCTRCGLDVLLTPKGYLASHSYIRREGSRPVLFSWTELAASEGKRGVILHCMGGGNRPSRIPTP